MTCLSSLVFASPWWAAALAVAIAVPLLAHLLSRGAARTLAFPATRFVRRAQADIAQFHRPRRLTLLALRAAALAAVVLAFMQPTWQTRAAGPGGPGHVIIVLDRSASMNRYAGGVSLFDDAKRRATDLLAAHAGGLASVVVLDRQPHDLLPEPTRNHDALRAALTAVTPSDERGDAVAAAALVERLIRAGGAEATIHVLTDAQATQWRDVPWPQGAHVQWHRLDASIANVSVRGLTVTPAAPVIGEPVLVTAEATNHGEASADVRIALRNAAERTAVALTLPPGGSQRVAFEATAQTPGEWVLRVGVDDADALAADDEAAAVVTVTERRRVVLVTQADAQDVRTATFYVARALAPTPDGPIKLDVVRPAELSALDGTDPAAFVLCDAGVLTDEAAEALRRRVEGGAGLLAIGAIGVGDLLPMHGLEWEADGGPFALRPPRADELPVFAGGPTAELLRHRYARRARGTLGPEASVLLTFEDGAPAAAWWGVGRGRVALLAMDVAPPSSDFARTPLFLPLLHELLRHVLPQQPHLLAYHPGVAVDAGGRVVDRVGLMTTDAGQAWVGIEREESDLRPLELESWAAQAATEGAGEARRDAPLWPYALMLAVSLLAAESLTLAAARVERGGAADA